MKKNYTFGHFLIDMFLFFATGGAWLVLIIVYWIAKFIRNKIEEKVTFNRRDE